MPIYHGTTLANAVKIEKDGYLKPHWELFKIDKNNGKWNGIFFSKKLMPAMFYSSINNNYNHYNHKSVEPAVILVLSKSSLNYEEIFKTTYKFYYHSNERVPITSMKYFYYYTHGNPEIRSSWKKMEYKKGIFKKLYKKENLNINLNR